jgi:tRNA (adenine22-N1)-methyltransferase
MLDERLTLAAALYDRCDLGADIGTDHAHLPCCLLETGVCRRMILSDVSPKAFARAQAEVRRRGLEERTRLICASGLDALVEEAQCVSVMGMGGRTIAEILRGGQEKLRGAALVLSAHTDQADVRRAVMDIGYTIEREELCRAAGRFYVFWKARPGKIAYDEEALDMGPLLMKTDSPLLREYLAFRAGVTREKLAGLLSAAKVDEDAVAQAQARLTRYLRAMED